jgi:hypothetical protein
VDLVVIFSFLLLTTVVPTPLSNEDAHVAIYDDVFLNAMIGNGNREVTYDWIEGVGLSNKPTIKIEALTCQARNYGQYCSFDLVRTPSGAAADLDPALISRLVCRARLRPNEDGNPGWTVVHLPPRRGGHSRTTMSCKASRVAR